MAFNTNRPLLYDKATEQALDAIRSGGYLSAAHPLQLFLNIQSTLATPYALRGDAAVQIAIFDHLKNVIAERLGTLRQPYELPCPDSTCADTHLIADFRQNNAELEAWSLLYYRYICVDRDLSMQQLAALTQQDARTLRRRHQTGITRLTAELVRREQQTRQTEVARRLRLALPVSMPPTLHGVESSLATALHILTAGDPPRHLVLHGPSGIGKTALARLVADRLIETRQIDDLLWVDLPSSIPSQMSLVHSFIQRLGIYLAADEDPVWTLRAYLLSHRTLIILDSAESLLEASGPEASDVSFLLALLDAAHLILTSAVYPAPSLWCYTISLPGLTRDQALDWLEQVLPQASDHAPAWADRFEQVWQTVGGNPMLLRTLLELSRTLPLDTALTQLDPLYEQIWQHRSPIEQQLCLLGLLFGRKGFTYEQIWQLSRLDNPVLDPVLLSLSRRGLWTVQIEQNTYHYQPSPLFAAFLSRHMHSSPTFSGDESLPVLLNRLLRRAAELLIQSPDPETALDLLRCANQWRDHGIESWDYVNGLAPQIIRASLWLDWYEQLLPLLGSEDDPPRAGWLHWMAGMALRWLGRLDESEDYLNRALAHYREADHAGQADAMSELAVVRRYQGRWREAYGDLQAALVIYTTFEQPPGIERCLHELAQLCLENGDPDQALDWLNRLSTWVLRSWGIAGHAYLALGQIDRAREATAQLEAHLPIGLPAHGRTTASLGVLYDSLGETDTAVSYFRLAIGLMERSKDMLGYARTCNNLAVAYLKQPAERRDETLDDIRQWLLSAQFIQEQIGDAIGLAFTRRNLSWLASDTGSAPQPHS